MAALVNQHMPPVAHPPHFLYQNTKTQCKKNEWLTESVALLGLESVVLGGDTGTNEHPGAPTLF